MNKLITIFFIVTILLGTPIALAETATYATTKVYFNIPEDTSYTIAMPDTYTGAQSFSITGTTEAGATSTDWISFNVSSLPAKEIEPYAKGDPTRNQNGVAQPIFLIDPTGNVNISIYQRWNETPITGINVSVNGTTTPTTGCGTFSSLFNITSTYQLAIQNLGKTGCYGNLTMYGYFETGISGGEQTANLLTKGNSSE
ncbi:MAG: hypothetical protein ACE5KT_00365 [Methanosarcinales archaeon]